jgi:DnaJ-class molecular chaperone
VTDILSNPQPDRNVQCIPCNGHGFRATGDRDPIEGSKMQGMDKCTRCKGAGRIFTNTPMGKATAAYWTVLEREQKIEEDNARKKRERLEGLKKSGLAKLTQEERQALGLEL